ncbi:hypothetical protein ACWCXK_16580 [Streptomyces sp. NPDC001739]|uniref:hypothetical protein n=1 Tax=unclassified Streptomyces TaxID=2593676 RepID=UPI001F40CEC4|nr:hypothetical protein [Streptomyces sp. NRRL S-1448]
MAFGGVHHRARGLQLDGTGEIESLAFQHQRFTDEGFQIDEEVVGIEFVGSGDDVNGTPAALMGMGFFRCVRDPAKSH